MTDKRMREAFYFEFEWRKIQHRKFTFLPHFNKTICVKPIRHPIGIGNKIRKEAKEQNIDQLPSKSKICLKDLFCLIRVR